MISSIWYYDFYSVDKIISSPLHLANVHPPLDVYHKPIYCKKEKTHVCIDGHAFFRGESLPTQKDTFSERALSDYLHDGKEVFQEMDGSFLIGIYNEDTDLSIRVLKAGYCTMLFTWCYCNKTATMQMHGGNTDVLYKNNGRYKMAKSLKAQHPDLVTITKKWGRWQHQVNYKPFKRNKLIKSK